MQVLTSVERIVLESIGRSPKGISELMRDTRLELKFLANILHALSLRSYIVLKEDGYHPNKYLPEEELLLLNDETAVRHEALELIEGLAQAKGKKLGVRKAWVSERDRAILKALLKNVEDFMLNLPPAPKEAAIHDYTLVVWGEDFYGPTIQRLIGGVA